MKCYLTDSKHSAPLEAQRKPDLEYSESRHMCL